MHFWTFLKFREIFEEVRFEMAKWFCIKFELREKHFYKKSTSLQKTDDGAHFRKVNFIWILFVKNMIKYPWYHEKNCWSHAAIWLKIISQQTKPTSNKNTILVIFPRKEKQKYKKRYVFKRDIIQSTHQTSKYIRWQLIYDAKLCLRDVKKSERHETIGKNWWWKKWEKEKKNTPAAAHMKNRRSDR